ncbi:hypothetical protein AA313_de0203826 [Arthrobotrys entomopaga]|nr:hypothetical protein AA313_de0203826 [Arthrobotrys entomopaga]
MSRRCPSSTYKTVARLPSYRWIICQRGYANIRLPSSSSSSSSSSEKEEEEDGEEGEGEENEGEEAENEVWGLLFNLTQPDEDTLDVYEGYPTAYEKETVTVELLEKDSEGNVQTVEALVYIDRKRVKDGRVNDEYIVRMKNAIEDGVRLGMPRGYVKDVMLGPLLLKMEDFEFEW